MKFSRPTSVEQLQIVGRFESLRKILADQRYAEHRSRPLAYWALPVDRRLPLAFLGRTLDDLLGVSYGELAGTPGIGQKKMASLVRLLARAADTDPAVLPAEAADRIATTPPPDRPPADSNGFDPAAVSEVVWAQWRAAVVKHGLGGEPLGRFSPSLCQMSRVLWNTPLSAYTGRTLAEIRAMKTHGEKRVRAVLEVFYCLNTIVAGMGTMPHLAVRIVPRRIDRADRWLGRMLQTPGVAADEEIRAQFICPMVEQIRVDASRQIVALAEMRLGIGGPANSVRQVARAMGLTRARVYQLLNEINDIMVVRWPEGRHRVYQLRERYQAEAARCRPPRLLEQFHAAVELFYPASRRGADGPLDAAV